MGDNIAFDAICHDIWNIFQLKPFRIDITYPYFGLGIVLTAIGLTLCIGSAYYYGISNNQYKDGFKKGFHAGVEYVIEFAKQKKNEE